MRIFLVVREAFQTQRLEQHLRYAEKQKFFFSFVFGFSSYFEAKKQRRQATGSKIV